VTGEEDENNVSQMNAKLHIFENGQWAERGRGCLRLNDNDAKEDQKRARTEDDNQNGEDKAPSSSLATSSGSRLVMRTSGSLRVVLNTPVFAGMNVDKPGEKTVRLTGFDDSGATKIYLLTTTPTSAAALYNALRQRVEALKENQNEAEEKDPTKGDKETEAEEKEKESLSD